jgi:asparagine synthase (glutamine-hydrolysing)
MCGIAGFLVPPGAAVSRVILENMTRTLTRRGPDDEGFFVDDSGGCALGHRRLSIIDLEGGRQPLATPDGQVQAIVNGEIYNFKELRRELESLGHEFRTNTDCEVVVHGYAAWGTEIIPRLDGMFALAIWDAARRRLILARDRMGKKPLYYAFVGNRSKTLLFGSELKALVAHPEMDLTVGPTAVASYLSYEGLPESQAIYEKARKLPQGHLLVYDNERAKTAVRAFWQMRFTDVPGVPDLSEWSEEDIAGALRQRIQDATEARLISDVPLGVFLSGGIDSSLVTAMMARLLPGPQIKTFSITCDDPSFEEGSYASKVARHLGTDHHEERLSPASMVDILPEIADFLCEPLGDASIIPTYLLSRFARQSVKVALGGDGGDELFLGYPTFQADQVARQIDRTIPRPLEARLGQAILRASRLLPVSRKNFSLDFKVKRFAQGLGWAPDLRHQAWMGSFMPDELERVLAEGYREKAMAENPYAIVAGFRELEGHRDHLDDLVYQYARLYLTASVLVKVDRASMACGLEVRAPLLDTAVVELACAIPGSLKLDGMTTKYILKKAARTLIPNEIIDRPKKGFGMPVAQWLRGPLRELAHDLLSRSRLRKQGYFSDTAVMSLLDEHDRGVADHRKPLWTLLMFQLWHDRYGPGSRSAERSAQQATPESAVLRQTS